jgi:hypothetical protein
MKEPPVRPMEHKSSTLERLSTSVIKTLQHAPLTRCIIYIGGVETMLVLSGRLYPQTMDWAEPARFVTVAPCIIAWTWGWATLRSEDRARYTVVAIHPWQVMLGACGMCIGIGETMRGVHNAA